MNNWNLKIDLFACNKTHFARTIITLNSDSDTTKIFNSPSTDFEEWHNNYQLIN